MSYIRVLALSLIAVSLQAQADRVGVDPRVELMSILFRLAGNNEYSQGKVPAYNQAIDRHFGAFREHAAVKLARELRQQNGVGFDAVMNLAVQVKDVETLAERIPFDSPDSKLEQRWHGVKARAFLEQARKFVADTDFAGFLKSQQPLYELTDSRLQEFVDKNADLEWFNRFFGAHARARFIIVPGLVNGGSSYGASIQPKQGPEEIYAIPGVWEIDGDGRPQFSGNWTPTLVHEFVHSYANPLIDKFATQLEQAGQRLFTPTRDAMQRQAYGSGKTVLYESLVRASTARYILAHQGAEAATRRIRDEQKNSFFWTGELFELLGEYEKNRAEYPALEAFMPRVVGFFNDASGRVDKMIAQYDESRPKVKSMNISNGARDVDPELKELVVRFDRPMRTSSYAITHVSKTESPKFGKPVFDETGKTLRVPVTLEPGKEYAFGLNWPGGGSFQSADGVPLKDVQVTFRTRPPEAILSAAQKDALKKTTETGENLLKGKETEVKLKLAEILQDIDRNLLSDKPDPELDHKLVNDLADAISGVLRIALQAKVDQARAMVQVLTPEQKKLLQAELQKPDANPDLTELIAKLFGLKK